MAQTITQNDRKFAQGAFKIKVKGNTVHEEGVLVSANVGIEIFPKHDDGMWVADCIFSPTTGWKITTYNSENVRKKVVGDAATAIGEEAVGLLQPVENVAAIVEMLAAAGTSFAEIAPKF